MFRILKGTLIVFTGTAFAATALAATTLTIPMKDGEGKSLGSAVLTEAKSGVEIKLSLQGLTPGEKAIHFHAKGDCKGPDFKSAGDHFAPHGEKHGQVEGGPHPGDMPNIKVGTDGKVVTTILNEKVSLVKGKPGFLQGPEGAALIIHAKPDDYKSQPSGDAGDRLLCGVVAKAK